MKSDVRAYEMSKQQTGGGKLRKPPKYINEILQIFGENSVHHRGIPQELGKQDMQQNAWAQLNEKAWTMAATATTCSQSEPAVLGSTSATSNLAFYQSEQSDFETAQSTSLHLMQPAILGVGTLLPGEVSNGTLFDQLGVYTDDPTVDDPTVEASSNIDHDHTDGYQSEPERTRPLTPNSPLADFSPPPAKRARNNCLRDWTRVDTDLKTAEMGLIEQRKQYLQLKMAKLEEEAAYYKCQHEKVEEETTFFKLQNMLLRKQLGLPEPNSDL